LTFPPFRLDRQSGRLRRGTEEISLRPKTLAVLCHLAEHAGRLVTRDELVHSVWHGAAGGAELPRGCIRELRRALDDDAAAPRLVETVGRRGYRFMVAVEIAPAVAAPPPELVRVPGSGVVLLVGRETARAELGRALDAATDGVRRLVFVTGEPGIG
jgi:DNA-binding winged helix-turn-helix (wHTH) protein